MIKGGALVDSYNYDDIIIKAYSNNDFEDYLQMQLEDKIYEYYDKDLIRKTFKETLSDTSRTENYSIFLSEGMTYCGNIELQKYPDSYALGIKLSEKYQHRGIGTLAVKIFCQYCFEDHGITQLVIRIDPDNKISIRLFEKLGAIYTGKKLTPEFERLISSSKRSFPESEVERLGANHYILNLPIIEQ